MTLPLISISILQFQIVPNKRRKSEIKSDKNINQNKKDTKKFPSV